MSSTSKKVYRVLRDDRFVVRLAPGETLAAQYDDFTGSRAERILTTSTGLRSEHLFRNNNGVSVFVLVSGAIDDNEPAPTYAHVKDAILSRRHNPGKRLYFGDLPKPFPRLRYACWQSGMHSIYVPGGDVPLHYASQLVVPDFRTKGSYWYIVPRKRIPVLLEKYTDYKGPDSDGAA